MYLFKKNFIIVKNFDQASVRNLLENRIGDAIIEDLIYILKICDAGKYSPARNEDGEEILSKTKIILQNVDKLLK